MGLLVAQKEFTRFRRSYPGDQGEDLIVYTEGVHQFQPRVSYPGDEGGCVARYTEGVGQFI